MTELKKLLQEICEEKGIQFTLLSKDWIIQLEKNGQTNYIVGMKFPLNSKPSSIICDDKYAMYEVLKNQKIPTIECKLLYDTKEKSEYESDLRNKKEIQEYLKKCGSVVVKDATGSFGKKVYHCQTYQEIKQALHEIFHKKNTAVVSPFVDILAEYRCICLDDTCELIYEKVRANGSWKHNLCHGASPRIVEDENLKQELTKFALQVMKAIHMRFASVDIINTNEGLLLLEVNSGVYMDSFISQTKNGREIAKQIYSKAIEKIF